VVNGFLQQGCKAAGQDLSAVQTFKILFYKVMVSKLSPNCHFLSTLIRNYAQNVLPPPFYLDIIEEKKTECILVFILFSEDTICQVQ
jgi:hypothetical protein